MDDTVCSVCGRGMSLADLAKGSFREMDGRLYCPECLLKQGRPRKMRCPHCGEQATATLHEGKYTCTHCHGEIGGEQESGVIESARPAASRRAPEADAPKPSAVRASRRRKDPTVQVLALLLTVFVATTLILGALLARSSRRPAPPPAKTTVETPPLTDASGDVLAAVEKWNEAHPKEPEKAVANYETVVRVTTDPKTRQAATTALEKRRQEVKQTAERENLHKKIHDLETRLATALEDNDEFRKQLAGRPAPTPRPATPAATPPASPTKSGPDTPKPGPEAEAAYQKALAESRKLVDRRQYGTAMKTLGDVGTQHPNTEWAKKANDERLRIQRDAVAVFNKQAQRADELVALGDYAGAKKLLAGPQGFGVTVVDQLVRNKLEDIQRRELGARTGPRVATALLERLVGSEETVRTKANVLTGQVKEVTAERIVIEKSFQIDGAPKTRRYEVPMADLAPEELDRLAARAKALPAPERVPEAVRQLIGILAGGSEAERAEAASKLGTVGNPAAVPHLLKALKDRDWLVRSRAALALGRIGDKSAVPALIDTLDDKEHMVRFDAAGALKELTGAIFSESEKAKWRTWYEANKSKLGQAAPKPEAPQPTSFRSKVLALHYDTDIVEFFVPDDVTITTQTKVELLRGAEPVCRVEVNQVARGEAYGKISTTGAGKKLVLGEAVTVRLLK